MDWNLGFEAGRFKPDLLQSFSRWMEGHTLTHWRAEKWDELLGFVTWEAPAHAQGAIWLAPNPQNEEEAMLALLASVRQYIPTRRTISLNVPSSLAAGAFTSAGFTLLNTLIWMSVATL